MEKTVLSKLNCRRAEIVSNIEQPQLGEFNFICMGKTVANHRVHIARNKSNEMIIEDRNEELNKWLVEKWRYDISFEHLYELAYDAYRGTSFYPEERAVQTLHEYEQTLVTDLSKIPSDEHEEYKTQFERRLRLLLAKRGDILSPMITGPAKFNRKKYSAKNESYENAYKDFQDWRSRYAKRAERRLEASKSEEEKIADAWSKLKRDIVETCKTICGIDNGTYFANRQLITNNLYKRLETIARHGDKELIDRATTLITQINGMIKKPIFTARHQFWKLGEVVQQEIASQEERTTRDPQEILFSGGHILKNYSDDRLQIFFDEIPDAEVRNKLKANGFKWSRRNLAWQRQLTQNSYHAAHRAIGVPIEDFD